MIQVTANSLRYLIVMQHSRAFSIFALLFALALSSCQRAASETTRITLELPTYSKVSADGILSCNPCLKEVVINIDGEKLQTIKYSNKVNIHQPGTQVSSEMTFDVPSGPKRKFQLLALYRSDTGAENANVNAYYGVQEADLSAAETTIKISLIKLGEVGGSISGRYITATNPDRGPSGKVKIEFVHQPSGMAVSLIHGEIINGWFSFVASNSESLNLTYKLESTGEVLFDGKSVSTASLKKKTSDAIMHMTRPRLFYSSSNGGTTYQSYSAPGDLVYGFFGTTATTASVEATKTVCVKDAVIPVSMDKTYISSDGTLATYGTSYDDTTNSGNKADFYSKGGVLFYTGNCEYASDSIEAFSADQIVFRKNQIDGSGDDEARSIEGAFTYSFRQYDMMSSSYFLKKFQRLGTHAYAVRPLPGLISSDNSTRYDGGRVFQRIPSNNAGRVLPPEDAILCNADWMKEHGYAEIGLAEVPAPNASGDMTFMFESNDLLSDRVILCPSKWTAGAPKMDDLGGIQLGDLRFAHLMPTDLTGPAPPLQSSGDATVIRFEGVVPTTSLSLILQVRNEANVTITNINSSSLGPAFSYTGGSYPGAAGDCGATIAANQYCSIEMQFSPASGDYTPKRSDVQIYYKVPYQTTPKSMKLILIGIAT